MLTRKDNLLNQKQVLWEQFPTVKERLMTVEALIRQQTNAIHGPVGTALQEVFKDPGKLLRPAFLVMFADFFTHDQEKIDHLAASIEMLHNATLIHDDIIDESDLRRGKPSVQAKYGKHIAVYAGDYLFALCFRVLSDYASDLKSMRYDSLALEKILGGELNQLDKTYNTEITINDYLEQITGKTAKLFGLSCFLGTFESGQSLRLSNKAQKFGELVGLSFQIKDDILDYTSSTTTFKKPVLADVQNGIYSAPLIYAMQEDSSGKLKNLVTHFPTRTGDNRHELLALVKQYHGLENAQKLADHYSEDAINLLQKNFPSGANRQNLMQLTNYLLKRTY